MTVAAMEMANLKACASIVADVDAAPSFPNIPICHIVWIGIPASVHGGPSL